MVLASDYYDEKGGGKKTGLDKKPLAMRNARISSLFGYRRHPIYKTGLKLEHRGKLSFIGGGNIA